MPPSKKLQPWPHLSSREIFRNAWMRLQIDRVQLPDGSSYDYTVIHRPTDGVAALIFDARKRILLEREYRYPVDEIIWQLPGGLAEPGEPILAAMQRELEEETGYIADHWERLGEFWDNPALSAMKVHLFLADEAQQNKTTHFDTAEYIETVWKPWDWVMQAVRSGEIKERVLLSALGMLLARGFIK